MAGGSYSDEIKAQALAALLAGQSYTQVSITFGIPTGTLKSWRQRTHGDLDALDASGSTTKGTRIGDLLIEYLEENLATLRAQAKVFRDETWLKTQSASEAAVLHGVLADKAVRLLEGLAPDDGPAADEAHTDPVG